MLVYSKFTDQELADGLRQGDERAFVEIYNRYWQTVYSIAYNRLREIESAQDLTHDTFASIWLNREKARIENINFYLAVAIKYRVFEYIRKRKLHIAFEQHSNMPVDLNSFAIEDAIHAKYIQTILEEEIESLPEKCKLIFKYSRDHNMSAREIAEELNLSQSTVENQLNKALNRLRATLKNIQILFLTL